MGENGEAADHSTAIHVEAGGQVHDITVQGDAAGHDIINITEVLTYDVSDLSANPYLGLASYTYATRDLYGGRETQIRDAVAHLTAPGEEPADGSPSNCRRYFGRWPPSHRQLLSQKHERTSSFSLKSLHDITADQDTRL